MRSSTSSSDPRDAPTGTQSALRRLPGIGAKTLLGALLLFVSLVAIMEMRLQSRGIQPTAVDDEFLWMRERSRAASLGERGLILVGASRIQTDVDPDVLRAGSGLEPVQLAIDGSSFLPVLSGLARDPRVRGTVIVSFQDNALVVPANTANIADRYERLYEARAGKTGAFDLTTIEATLTGAVRHRLRSYADGARPISSLLARVLPASITPQYSVFLPDRSRLADYSKVSVSFAYYNRVLRELGADIEFAEDTDHAAMDAQLKTMIEALPKASAALYLERAAAVAADAATIEQRGGKVIFVVMPTSGLITDLESRQFPRAEFWDRFAGMTHSRTLHFQDDPALRACPVPDGSHIDYRNRAALTQALQNALQLHAANAGRP